MWLSQFLVVLIVFALCSPAGAQQAKKVPTIGVVVNGSGQATQCGSRHSNKECVLSAM